MTGLELALLAFALMLVAIFLRVPIGVAMAVTGFVGSWIVLGRPTPALAQLKSLTYDTFKDYNLSIVPLFLLMGQFATKSGMSSALFQAASDWLGHRKGGIAMASVGACAGFGAICGSSLATASTMGQVALPEMRKRGYSDALSTGVLAAGGTLGILIPPSIILVIYAILAEQNIVKMFVAAIVPGILAAIGYMLAVAVYVRVRPSAATTAERVPYGERLRTLARVWPVVVIFGLVMGGIAADWDWTQDGVQALFTPTEGAAVGAVATGLYGIFTRGLDVAGLSRQRAGHGAGDRDDLLHRLGGEALQRVPRAHPRAGPVGDMDRGLGLRAAGGAGDHARGLSPVRLRDGFAVHDPADDPDLLPDHHVARLRDPRPCAQPEEAAIWFGILALIVVEVGLITPPVGMNLFIINSMARDIPMSRTYAGVAPFVASDLIRVVILVMFPGITLWLVGVLFG
jgi:TRAP-type C4-dicarboxylate transport system permease large subunit